MATRRTSSNPRRDEPAPRGAKGGKSGSLLTGLFIGLVTGLVVAAGLAWYFINRTPAFQNVESSPPLRTHQETPSLGETAPETEAVTAEPSIKSPPGPAGKPGMLTPAPEPTTPPPLATSTTPNAAPNATPSAIKPRVDYTFYGILPGDKPAKPIPPPRSKDIWWLQVAALKNPGDADKLKARLLLLGLEVATQRVESDGIALYRIRVGPYKREDDALGDLDTLAENNFEPRLFKEPNPPLTVTDNKEKP